MGYEKLGDHAQPQSRCRLPLHALPAVWLFFPGRAGRCHVPQPTPPRRRALPELKAAGKAADPGEKGIAAATCLGYIGTNRPARDGLKAAENRRKPGAAYRETARKRFYHSGHSRPLFPGAWHNQAAEPAKPCKQRLNSLIQREEQPATTITGQKRERVPPLTDRQGAISTRFYAGERKPVEKAVNRSDKNHPKMIPETHTEHRGLPRTLIRNTQRIF